MYKHVTGWFWGTVVFSALLHAQFITAPGAGWEAQGAGLDLVNLDNDPRPELILMAYDNPSGQNNFRYRIGWNIGFNGVPVSWSGRRQVGGVGWEGQGAGMTTGNIDNNPRPEFVFMANDNPAGANTFRYRVGWNVNTAGNAASWSSWVIVTGAGWEAQGADLALTQLDGNPRPELILMAYDNPAGQNSFKYRIGWNLNTSGIATSWSGLRTIGGLGWEAEGAGLAIGNLGGSSRPDMVLMAYDGYPNSPKTFRHRIGWDLDGNGNAASWTNEPLIAGFGWSGQGAGVAIRQAGAGGTPDLYFMANDSPAGPNNFRYAVNPGARLDLVLEIDRLNGLGWPPASVTRFGNTHSLTSLYNTGGVNLTEQRNTTAPDLNFGQPYNDQEIDAFRQAFQINPTVQFGVQAAVLTSYVNAGTVGVMYDTNQRRGFAVFANAMSGNQEYMRTMAHVLGMTLCLEQDDGDGYWRRRRFLFWTWWEAVPGRSIMNPPILLRADWDFLWSGASLQHFLSHDLNRWRPWTGLPFGQCH